MCVCVCCLLCLCVRVCANGWHGHIHTSDKTTLILRLLTQIAVGVGRHHGRVHHAPPAASAGCGAEQAGSSGASLLRPSSFPSLSTLLRSEHDEDHDGSDPDSAASVLPALMVRGERLVASCPLPLLTCSRMGQGAVIRLARGCVFNQHAKVAEAAVGLFDPTQRLLFPLVSQSQHVLESVRQQCRPWWSRSLLTYGPRVVCGYGLCQVLATLHQAKTHHWSPSVKRRAATVAAMIAARARYA